MDFWLSSEDLPGAENRIYYDGERVVLEMKENNLEAHHRLKKKLQRVLNGLGTHPTLPIIANALRIADLIGERLGAGMPAGGGA